MLALEHNAQMWQVCHKLVCTVDLTVYELTVESPSPKDKKAIFDCSQSNLSKIFKQNFEQQGLHIWNIASQTVNYLTM
jgi:hypothetical protein